MTADGQQIRFYNLVDEFIREALATRRAARARPIAANSGVPNSSIIHQQV